MSLIVVRALTVRALILSASAAAAFDEAGYRSRVEALEDLQRAH